MSWLIAALLSWSLFLIPAGALAEEGSPISLHLREAGGLVLRDYKHYYSLENLVMLGSGLAIGGVLANTSLDREFREWYRSSLRSDTSNDASEGLKYLGRGLLVVPCFVGAAVLGELAEDTRAGPAIGEWGTRSLRTLLVGVPPTLLLQYTLGGSRPREGDSHWKLFDGNESISGHSFVGAVPFIVAAQMSSSLYWKVPLYLASTLVGLSRVDSDAHYLSQAALGWWLAYLAAASVDQTGRENRNFSILPTLGPGAVGLQVLLRY